jgi:uncharacterized caspase-like protein/uncharacterized membrane protein
MSLFALIEEVAMQCVFRIVVALSAFLVGTCAVLAQAEKRVALVIGNSAYQSTRELNNPKNDSEAIAGVLRRMGFSVTLQLDRSYRQFRDDVRSFSEKARSSEIALIHFAGHGLELAGENYLLPVDARLARDVDLEYEAITLSSLLRATLGAQRLRVVIVDACRNNPLGEKMALSMGVARSVTRGLARVEPQGDVLLAFSAKAGTLAKDGDGPMSPYAQALVKHLATPGLDVRLLFGRVRDQVLAATKHDQEPYIYGSLKGEVISLVPSPTTDLAGAPQEFARFAAEAAAKAKAEEAEAKRLAEEAAKKRLEAEAEAARLKRETEIALAETLRLKEEAEERRRQIEEAEEARKKAERDALFSFRVCNKSSCKISVAISHYSDKMQTFLVEGWFTVEMGKCGNLGSYKKGWFYYYAQCYGNSRLGRWAGKTMICVEYPGPFTRVRQGGTYTCQSREDLVGFFEVRVDGEEWTQNLRD